MLIELVSYLGSKLMLIEAVRDCKTKSSIVLWVVVLFIRGRNVADQVQGKWREKDVRVVQRVCVWALGLC